MGIFTEAGIGAVLAVVVALAVANIFLLYARGKKRRKSTKKLKEECIASVKRHEHLKNRLEHELEDASRRAELRNKTLDMYQQVKDRAAESEGP